MMCGCEVRLSLVSLPVLTYEYARKHSHGVVVTEVRMEGCGVSNDGLYSVVQLIKLHPAITVFSLGLNPLFGTAAAF
jgi:hypothetical protein